jgi:hypothetical protein
VDIVADLRRVVDIAVELLLAVDSMARQAAALLTVAAVHHTEAVAHRMVAVDRIAAATTKFS